MRARSSSGCWQPTAVVTSRPKSRANGRKRRKEGIPAEDGLRRGPGIISLGRRSSRRWLGCQRDFVMVEAAGIEPASQSAPARASTCVVDRRYECRHTGLRSTGSTARPARLISPGPSGQKELRPARWCRFSGPAGEDRRNGIPVFQAAIAKLLFAVKFSRGFTRPPGTSARHSSRTATRSKPCRPHSTSEQSSTLIPALHEPRGQLSAGGARPGQCRASPRASSKPVACRPWTCRAPAPLRLWPRGP